MGPAGPAVYEFRVSGEIGAVIVAAFPEFSATTVPRQSVLAGQTDRVETILALLATLERHRLVAGRIQILSLVD
jgi:hypothetical protein